MVMGEDGDPVEVGVTTTELANKRGMKSAGMPPAAGGPARLPPNRLEVGQLVRGDPHGCVGQAPSPSKFAAQGPDGDRGALAVWRRAAGGS